MPTGLPHARFGVQYSYTRILDLQYSTVDLGSYTAVQYGSYCITVLAVRILLY